MRFEYRAKDGFGHTHEGSLEADSREEARRQLLADGLQAVDLKEESGGLQLFKPRIKKTDLIYAVSQMSIMIDTGINLAAALHAIGEQAENPTLRSVLGDVKVRVEAGEDLSAALAQHPRHFDTTFIALIRASEQTGSMAETLEEVSRYMTKEVESRSKVRAAMTYPAVMVFLAAGVTIFLLTFVLPKFNPLFSRDGVQLPPPTVIMMSVSEALLNYWWAYLLGLASLIGGVLYARKTPEGRKVFDQVKLNLPILGPMFQKVILSRSIRTLGIMVKSGVSMLDALQLAAEVAGNYHYERIWLHVKSEVTNGSRICDALQGQPLFPKTLIQMIASGEETGRLDYVMQKVSSFYEREVDTALKTATSLIEPVMITVMGIVVGGIGMGIMLPIFQLSQAH